MTPVLVLERRDNDVNELTILDTVDYDHMGMINWDRAYTITLTEDELRELAANILSMLEQR